MKRRAPISGLLALTIALSMSSPANAESFSSYLTKVPGVTSVDLRQAEIEKRLRDAVAAGRLTLLQSQSFTGELDKIADLEATYRASHGKLSLWENLKLLFQLDNLSRKIEQSLGDRQVADTNISARLTEMDRRIEDGLSSQRLTKQEASGFTYDLERIKTLHKLLTDNNTELTDTQSLQFALDLDRLSSRLESIMHDRQIELPEIDKAQDEIAGRIAAGVDKGQLTKEDAKEIQDEYQKIADREATLKGYGRPLTSAESLALAVDLEKLSRELDLKLRNSEVADKSYQEKSEVLGNRIASGVVTGRLTLAEAHYLKDRLDRLSQRESEWRKDGKLTTSEQKALTLELEKLSITVERRLNDRRFSWGGVSKTIADIQSRLEDAKVAGRMNDGDQAKLARELDKLKANWEAIRQNGGEGVYPLKDSLFIVSALDELSRNLSDSLRDRDIEIPGIQERKDAIDHRIAIGVISGRLTLDEGQLLLDEFDKITAKEDVYRGSDKELSDREKLTLALLTEKLSSKVERGIHEGSNLTANFEQLRQELRDDIEEGIISGDLTEKEAEQMKNELTRIEASEKSYKGSSGDLSASQALTLARALKELRQTIDTELSDTDVSMPDIDKRRQELEIRISEGITSGKLEKKDAEFLRTQLGKIEELNKKYSASGGLSLGEAATIAWKLERLGSSIEERMKSEKISLPDLASLHSDIDQRLADSIASGVLSLDQVKAYKDRLEAIARMEMGFRYTGDGLSYPETLMLTKQLQEVDQQLELALKGKSASWKGIEDRIDKTGKRIADGVVTRKLSTETANSLKAELDRISSARLAFAHSEGGYSLDETETLVSDIDRLNSEIDLHLKGQKFAWSDIDRRQSNLEKTLKQLIASGKIKGSDATILTSQLDKIKRAKAAFTLSDGSLNYFERVSLGEALDNFNLMMKRTIK